MAAQGKTWIGRLFRRRVAWGVRFSRRNIHTIHSADEFRDILRRERGRVDRNSHCFSLAVFDVPDTAERVDYTKRLTTALVECARFTDSVGWLGDDGLGVLLPETLAPGAWMFADRIRLAMSDAGFVTSHKVYTYPIEGPPATRPPDDKQLWFEALESYRRKNPMEPPAEAPLASAQAQRPAAQPIEDALHWYFNHPLPLWKRTMDIVVSGLALVLLTPVLLLMGVLIKLVSPGPVLFKQARIGYLGRHFNCLKFRTMHVREGVECHRRHLSGLINSDAPMTKLDAKQDSRIIPFGRFLRQSALDELPQLLNVFRGQMSLVGPRPCIPYEFEEYRVWHKTRTMAVPGLTGLWQVSGKNETTFLEMMRLDIAYERRMSLWLDLQIVLMTVPTIVSQIREGMRARRRRVLPEAELEIAA